MRYILENVSGSLKCHDLIGIYIHFIKGYCGQNQSRRTASWDNKETHRLGLVFFASFLL